MRHTIAYVYIICPPCVVLSSHLHFGNAAVPHAARSVIRRNSGAQKVRENRNCEELSQKEGTSRKFGVAVLGLLCE